MLVLVQVHTPPFTRLNRTSQRPEISYHGQQSRGERGGTWCAKLYRTVLALFSRCPQYRTYHHPFYTSYLPALVRWALSALCSYSTRTYYFNLIPTYLHLVHLIPPPLVTFLQIPHTRSGIGTTWMCFSRYHYSTTSVKYTYIRLKK